MPESIVRSVASSIIRQPRSAHRDDQRGFTLIEVLVVVLIIGVLAAIAIPSFLSQKTKADDAQAKSVVRTAETAMEAYATGNSGSYSGVTPSALQSVEATLSIVSNSTDAYLSAASGTQSTYTIVATSPSDNDLFSIVKNGNVVTRSCSGTGGGCVNSTW